MKQNILTTLSRLNYPLNLLVLLTALSCCGLNFGLVRDFEISNKEVCIYSDESQKLQCTDLSQSKEHQSYSRDIRGGDVVTNSTDFVQGVNETVDLIKELKECGAGL